MVAPPRRLTPSCESAMGFHSESIVFSALTAFLLFRMLSEEKPSLAYPVLLGLTAGVGLWFAYIYGLTLLAMLGFWFWHDKGRFWRPRMLWFTLGFLAGFFPWIVINAQTHFAGLVVHYRNVWEHFGLDHLWDGLAHPRRLSLYEFFADIASVDDWDWYRRGVTLLFSRLYLAPILTAGVLRWKTGRSAPAGAYYSGRGPRVSTREAGTRPSRTHPTRPTLVGFASLYVVVFALVVQFSDFKSERYHLPAYPFLFFPVAHSLARCQDRFPHVQRQIQTVFLASVVVLGLGTHAPLLSLDRPGFALTAKGYSYALMPSAYLYTHAPAGPWNPELTREGDREFLMEVMRRPLFSSVLPKLSSDDQRELSRSIVLLLAEAVRFNGQAEDFARLERLVPPGFDKYFAYSLGMAAMERHPNELPKAVAAVGFLRHRTPAMHHLALIRIYRAWPWVAPLDSSPEALADAPAPVAPGLLPPYSRAPRLW